MIVWLTISLGLLGSVLLFLGALGTHLLSEISWHELKQFCKRLQRPSRFDEVFDHFEDVMLGLEAVRAAGGFVVLLALATWMSDRWQPASEARPTVVLGVLAAGLLLLLIVWLPTALSRVWGEPLLAIAWPVFRVAAWLFHPLALGAVLLETVFRRVSGEPPEPPRDAFEDEVLSIVTEGMHDGHLLEDAREMIEGVIELPDRDVADIMTPRSDVDALPLDLSWDELLPRVAESGRTRLPVYHDELDNVVGVLYVKDLLAEIAHQAHRPPRPIRAILRRAWTVPKTVKLDKMLKRFLKTRSHLAIVTEEHRVVAGIVTIEDVLEEIVGEIVDEFDQEEVGEIHRMSESLYEIAGRAHVADVNETLGLDLPEPDDFDTVAGLVIHTLGHIPQPGEVVRIGDCQVTVLSATKRRIVRLRLRQLESSAD